jgi:hypothetical protein
MGEGTLVLLCAQGRGESEILNDISGTLARTGELPTKATKCGLVRKLCLYGVQVEPLLTRTYKSLASTVGIIPRTRNPWDR